MSQDRLTRHEISWLLAQEARGAAKALREGVTRLTNPPPSAEQVTSNPSVHTTLDALDGAIGMLSMLQSQPSAQPGSRRGRIDLAALLYEVAPQARLKMAPGEGTEVFGDEADLRRIVHMLLNHANPSSGGSTASPEVDIRRDGEMVKISVDLGPDSSATSEIERRWLSRMAVQHGGRLEYKGGRQSLFLPADGATDQREVVELRKELEQAQQLGEAYARELAGVFHSGATSREEVPSTESVEGAESFRTLVGLAAGLDSTVKDWLDGCREDVALAGRELGDASVLVQRLNHRFSAMQQLQRELGAIRNCSSDEKRANVEVTVLARDAVEAFANRCAQSDIQVELRAPESCVINTYPKALQLLLRSMLEHAIVASPRGKSISVQLFEAAEHVDVAVADAGPNVPRSAQRELAHHLQDPAHLGRPGGISLLVASAAAGRLGGTLQLGEAADARTQTSVRLARSL